jgi:hypothetical protein
LVTSSRHLHFQGLNRLIPCIANSTERLFVAGHSYPPIVKVVIGKAVATPYRLHFA